MLLFLFVALSGVRAQSAFTDVPAGHWAIQDIESLVQEGVMAGFPDGTFKGRSPITRYDMAKIVARMLAQIQRKQEEGAQISPDQALRVNRLIDEFRSELDLLGVRLDSLENRVGLVERRTFDLESALSNVRVEGFYRLENTFIYAPFDFTNYIFDVAQNPFTSTAFQEPGLQPLNQEAFLRFIGTPFIGGELFRNVDAFVELRAIITGPTNGNARLEYRFSGPGGPVVGDNLDDIATNVVDEQRVSVDKAHLRVIAKQFTLRAFSNESLQDLSDPAVLFTLDSFDPPPFSGVEVNGTIKKFSYFGSVLKQILLDPSPFPNGNDPLDLRAFFTPLTRDENDFYNLRFFYEPYKNNDAEHRMVLGATYTESVYSYDIEENFSRVMAMDVTYSHKKDDTAFDITIEPQFSFGINPDLRDARNVGPPDIDTAQGEAFRLDSSYQNGGFLASYRGHTFSHDFSVANGQRQYLDFSLPPYRDNFRRTNNADDPFDPAETLHRLQLRQDFTHQLLTVFKNFSLTVLGENKKFARDLREPRLDDDRSASRWYLQAIADLNDDTHVEMIHEEQYHLPPNSLTNGQLLHQNAIEDDKLTVDFKLTDKTSFVGELEQLNDDNQDAIGPDGKGYRMDRALFRINSQVTDNVFVATYVEQVTNALQRRTSFEDTNGNVIRPLILNERRILRPQRNGLDIRTLGAETNISMFDNKLAFRGYAFRESAADVFNPVIDGATNILVGELDFNFTRALRAKYVHAFHDENLKLRLDNFALNRYFEVQYQPSEKTDIKLTFGYDYENPADRFDNGPLLFWKTHEIVQLRAQTEF